MMNYVTVLALIAESAGSGSGEVVPIDAMWDYVTSVNWLEALTFVSFGAVCLLYGWRVFKILVVICFALMGLGLGIVVGERIMGDQGQLWAGLVAMLLLAGLSVPLMRWAVSILGAAAGGVVTAGIWYACGLTETYIWAGALVGVVAGGMISFIVFKVAVMLFSSLGGSALIVVGGMALVHIYTQADRTLEDLVRDHNWFVPVALLVPTVIGFIVQNRFIKTSKEWEV